MNSTQKYAIERLPFSTPPKSSNSRTRSHFPHNTAQPAVPKSADIADSSAACTKAGALIHTDLCGRYRNPLPSSQISFSGFILPSEEKSAITSSTAISPARENSASRRGGLDLAYQLCCLINIVNIGCGCRNGMDISCSRVHAGMHFHAEMPLISLFGLMHFRVTFAGSILG